MILLAILAAGCSPPERPAAVAAETPGRESEVRARYRELEAEGRPERIGTEFPLHTLVQEAPALFKFHAELHNLRLYSDQEFAPADGRNILKKVREKLSSSPLFRKSEAHSAFLCNAGWREELFLQGSGRLGGLNYFPTAPNVFFTRARVKDDVLLSPRGYPIARPRTLAYYVAHEFTHTLVGQALGQDRYQEMPLWVFEGYPDFVALGPDYTFEEALAAYRNRDPRVAGTLAEDYLRYGAMVAYVLDKKGLSVRELLDRPPEEAAVAREAGVSD